MPLESAANVGASGATTGVPLAAKVTLGVLSAVIAVTGGAITYQLFNPRQLSHDSSQSNSLHSDRAQSTVSTANATQSALSTETIAASELEVRLPPTREEMGNMTLDVPLGCTYLVGEYGASPNTVKVAFTDGKALATGAELAVRLSIEDYAVVSNGNERGALVHFKCQYPRGDFQSFLTVYSPEMLVKGNLYAGSDEITDFIPASGNSRLFADIAVDGDAVGFTIPKIRLAEDLQCEECGHASARVTASWDGQYLNLEDYIYEANGRTLPRLNEARVQEVVDAIAAGDYNSIRPLFLEGAWQEWDAPIFPGSTRRASLRTVTFDHNPHIRNCRLIGSLQDRTYTYYRNDGMNFTVPQSLGFEAGDYVCPIYQNNIGSDEVIAQSLLVVRPLDDGDVRIVAFNRYYG